MINQTRELNMMLHGDHRPVVFQEKPAFAAGIWFHDPQLVTVY
jgi:hypothetical protein